MGKHVNLGMVIPAVSLCHPLCMPAPNLVLRALSSVLTALSACAWLILLHFHYPAFFPSGHLMARAQRGAPAVGQRGVLADLAGQLGSYDFGAKVGTLWNEIGTVARAWEWMAGVRVPPCTNHGALSLNPKDS